MLQPNTDLGDSKCWTTTAIGENTPTFEKHFGGLLYRKGHERLSKDFSRIILEHYGDGDGYRFIHDIVPRSTIGVAKRIRQRVQEETYNKRKPTVIIVYHPEEEEGHLHVFHRCLYYSSYCRCTFLRGITVKRRRARFTPELSRTNSADFWFNWLKYFLQDPREIVHLEIAGMDYSAEIRRLKNLQQPECLTGEEADGILEGSYFSCQSAGRDLSLISGANSENQSLVGDIDSAIDSRNKEPARLRSSRKGLKMKNECAFLLQNIEELLCIPVESSCDTLDWLTHPGLIFFNKAEPDYKKACSAYLRRTQYLTFDQLFELHQNAKNPKYYQRTPEPYYYSVAESLEYSEKLLLHQYGDYEQVKNFLQRLFDITEKIIPKKNTMHIIGEANSGKSWFFEMVASFHLNIGHVKNFNKFTSFPLNDCPNRRILIWNEPSIVHLKD